jgi:hypothetical protein
LAGLLCQLEPDGLTGLFLSDRGPINCVSTRRNILDFEGDDIAATQLAIDGQIEHRQVACPSLDLQLGPDRPYVFWPERRLCPNQLALVPRHAREPDCVCVFVMCKVPACPAAPRNPRVGCAQGPRARQESNSFSKPLRIWPESLDFPYSANFS